MKKPAPFGKYYLLERINVGGMAEVFRAKAFGVEGFERLVAVKRILPNIAEDKEFIRMFIDEAKLSVQLNHANIAQIFDLGVVDGSYYIALEHVHGRDLRGIFDRCRQLGESMPVSQACFMVMKICEGLDYAHNKRDQSGRELQLVHRDVSPQNVLISFEGEVKLIDFGIAKAAGKGSKTQAGILKGKFGYMSPEQVRGLPVDRRSDVFSCGIVLYELLTGERLFVGESDFSTLEKVRNVEILPPSTYNRRIPDELERIVLKALAKDVDDRYQNAIDLHDELQAFVYTAGEFYSRKDLAGWMKRTFGREIEEETAKLESYRQLKPPPAEPPPAAPRTTTGRNAVAPPPPAAAQRRSTQGMAAVGTKPPPPPNRTSQQVAVSLTASASGQQKVAPAKAARGGDDDLAWDDDELETQIYDNPEEEAKAKAARASGQPLNGKRTKGLPLVAPPTPQPSPASTMTGMGLGAVAAAAGSTLDDSDPALPPAPDLSSLAQSTKGWDGPKPGIASPSSTLAGLGPNGAPAALRGGATGSNPMPAEPTGPLANVRVSEPVGTVSMFDSGPSSYSAPFDPMASFGAGITARKQKSLLPFIIGGAVLAVAAVIAVVLLMGKDETAIAQTAPTDQNTGFDLYVTPAGITQWKLDGEARTDRLPSRIRGITPGEHTVAIEPPAGFMSQNQKVVVEPGKAGRVEITLQPIAGLTGVFESTPPGATVTLIFDGQRKVLGPSPVKAELDPRKTYQVLYELGGYVSVNKPVAIKGGPEERLAVSLEKISPTAGVPPVADAPTPTPTPPTPTPAVADAPKPKTPKQPKQPKPPVVGIDEGPVTSPEKPEVVKPAAKGEGTLTLGSKPPCEIYVDGSATGLHTPQRAMKLSSGKHKITLVNNEFGIKESFTVDVKADDTVKMIKDYSDKLPK